MPRILVADDEPVARRYLAGLLAPHAEVEVASGGAEAVDRFTAALDEGRPFDLAVLDIMMPGVDGIAAARLLRKAEADRGLEPARACRVLMLSCLEDGEAMLKAQYEAGADGYLTKPAEPAVFLEALANLGILDNPRGRAL